MIINDYDIKRVTGVEYPINPTIEEIRVNKTAEDFFQKRNTEMAAHIYESSNKIFSAYQIRPYEVLGYKTEGEYMEKLGVEKQDLLKELRGEYQALREKEAELIKTGSDQSQVLSQLDAVKARIDELEAQ